MNTFFNILVVVSIIISIGAIIILSWALIAIHRKEKGLQDFKEFPFFIQNMKINYDINVANTTGSSSIKRLKEKQEMPVSTLFFSFYSNEKSRVSENIKLNNSDNNLILN